MATSLGLYIRLAPVLRVDFPLNDGGMFYTMVQDLIDNRLHLPYFIAYNSGNVPFAYPPFAFYFAAIAHNLTGWDLLEMLRLLPAMLSAFCIPAFYLLSRSILNSRSQAALGTFAFALLPRSFEWLIMGGGLTRAPGLFFALLSLQQVYHLYTQSASKRHFLGTVFFASLTILTHPEAAWFTAYSAVLMFIFFGRNRLAVLKSAGVAVGVIGLTSIWWVPTLDHSGFSALRAASSSHFGTAWQNLLGFNFTHEPLLPILGVLGLIGVFYCLFDKKFFLPVWLALIFFVESRSGATFAVIPMAMLVSMGTDQVLLYRFNNRSEDYSNHPGEWMKSGGWANQMLSTPASRLLLGYLLLYALTSAYLFPFSSQALHPLPEGDRKAMRWIRSNTDQSSQFIVATGNLWWQDFASEWLPALAQRVSLLTVQGSEWLPGDEFDRRWLAYESLQNCVESSSECLQAWEDNFDTPLTYIYFAAAPETSGDYRYSRLSDSLLGSQGYVLIYQDHGVRIFYRKSTDSIQSITR
jgi:hypothetical protein